MKREQQININELRLTLEYWEAVALLEQKRHLDSYRNKIKKQLTALQRLSRAAVVVARNDMAAEE